MIHGILIIWDSIWMLKVFIQIIQVIHYTHIGIAFIKFEKEKKLILWKDNNYEKKNINPQIYTEQYNNFFMLAAAFDFLGEMI